MHKGLESHEAYFKEKLGLSDSDNDAMITSDMLYEVRWSQFCGLAPLASALLGCNLALSRKNLSSFSERGRFRAFILGMAICYRRIREEVSAVLGQRVSTGAQDFLSNQNPRDLVFQLDPRICITREG